MKQASYTVWHLALICMAALIYAAPVSQAAEFKILQALGDKPMQVKKSVLPWGGYYVPTTVDTVTWGTLPNIDSKPVLSVPSGSVVTNQRGQARITHYGRKSSSWLPTMRLSISPKCVSKLNTA